MIKLIPKQISTFLVATLFCGAGFSQSLWQKVDASKTNVLPTEAIEFVTDFSLQQVNFENLKKALTRAPEEFSKAKGLKMIFPMPDGSEKEFLVFHSPIMEQGLQDKYPEMRNYKIISTERDGFSGRIGITLVGFHGIVSTPNGKVFIDKYSDSSKDYYASYYTENYTKEMTNIPACGVTGMNSESFLDDFDFDNLDAKPKLIKTRTPEGAVTLRTYRTAIACTGEWGFAKGNSVASALSAINESLTKINEIFELEVGIRFLLVANNDKLIHLNSATDPYINSTTGAQLIGENTAVLNSAIGFSAYDIGHVYTVACNDVGGIASLQSVCGASKGNGVTCHYSSNIDLISLRVACHEIGHQFGARHTFNHCDGENESTSTGYEPGSGHTIMSYAGGCGPALNVANEPYPYYHGINIEEMTYFSQEGNGNSCAGYIETGNTNPVVELDYVNDFNIPISTPFRLTGKATDAENDVLLYSWEEFDLGPLTTPGLPILDAPQFVSEVPDFDPERVFPAMSKVLSNINDKLEVLPFYNKDMTFRLTVRDHNPEAGGSDWAEVQFNSVESAGPFFVTYPNSPESFVSGEKYTITWNVANTDGALVNCQFVDIKLSVDGGLTYPHTLASFTANDGTEDVIIPNAKTNFARFMVSAADNIFFDLSNANSVISEATEPGYSATIFPGFQALCLPNQATVEIKTEKYLDFTTPINLEVISGVPVGATVNFANSTINPGENTTLEIDATNVLESGIYDIVIRGIADVDTFEFTAKIEFTSSDYSELATIYPAKGESGITSAPEFIWADDSDADSYIFELSDDPSFLGGEINIIKSGLTEAKYKLTEALFKNTVYYWRVSGVNKCGVGFTTDLSTFASESLSCQTFTENVVPINLPSSGTPTVELETVVVTGGLVSDVNVRLLKGTHTNFKDLVGSIVSPAGTVVELFNKRCAGSTSFNGGFDSDSPLDIECPLTNGKIYKPEGDLSVFNGESLIGTWKLRIEDTKAGDGGKITDYTLDLCSNASLSAPFIVANYPLPIGPNQTRAVNGAFLLIDDNDNDYDEIVLTLVELPTFGELFINGIKAEIGSKISQESINNSALTYVSNNEANPVTDQFVFTANDGEGGWIDLTAFVINVDIANDIKNSDAFNYDVLIYPNPTNDFVNVQIPNLNNSSFTFEITDLLGRTISNETIYNENKIRKNVADFPSGVYFFKVTIDNSSRVFKVQVN